LALAQVISALPLYNGGVSPTFQEVNVVDALTVDVKLSEPATAIYTADITQLIAASAFARAADGIYPDVSDPYAAHLLGIDNIVTSTSDIDGNTAATVTALNAINTNLIAMSSTLTSILSALSVTLPTSVYGQYPGGVQHPGNSAVLTLAQVVAEGLLVPNIARRTGYLSAPDCVGSVGTTPCIESDIEYIGAARGLIVPRVDPAIESFRAGNNCETFVFTVGDVYEPPIRYGTSLLAANLQAGDQQQNGPIPSTISPLPILGVQSCQTATTLANQFGVPLPNPGVLVQPFGTVGAGTGYTGLLNAPYCQQSSGCPSFIPP